MLDDPTPQKVVKFAAATEDMGEQTYRKLAEKYSDQKEISEAFSILAADERAHRAQFEALLEQLPPDEGAMTDDEQHRYLSAMAHSEFFRGDTELTKNLDDLKDLQEALLHALGFEKATLGFYRAVEDVLGQNDVLEAIIRAEKSHITRLMKYLLTDEKMKSLQDPY
jgi:rubrerythrin